MTKNIDYDKMYISRKHKIIKRVVIEMILNDALYLISASRRGRKFNQILIRKDYGTCVDLDGNDLDGLIEKKE